MMLYSTFNRVLDECAGCGEFVCMGAVDGWHRKKRVIRCCCGKTITGRDAVAVLVKWNRLQRKLKAKKTGNKNKWLRNRFYLMVTWCGHFLQAIRRKHAGQ